MSDHTSLPTALSFHFKKELSAFCSELRKPSLGEQMAALDVQIATAQQRRHDLEVLREAIRKLRFKQMGEDSLMILFGNHPKACCHKDSQTDLAARLLAFIDDRWPQRGLTAKDRRRLRQINSEYDKSTRNTSRSESKRANSDK